MRNARIFIFLGIILFLIILFLDLPKPLSIKFHTPIVPFLNKSLSVDKTIPEDSFYFNFLGFSFSKTLQYELGLDLQGGVRVVYEADMRDIRPEQRDDALESLRDVIERRVNFFGVKEPTIQTSKIGNSYRIIVELPGVSDVSEALSLIGRTASLSFWEGQKNAATRSASILPSGISEIFLVETPVKTNLSGKDLTSARVVYESNTGRPQVQLNFTQEGAKKFAEITKRNVGKPVAIVLDNEVLSAPRVQEPILNGNAVITGSFTAKEARNLAIALNAGALPALGFVSLKRSLVGGILGFFSVIAFMSFLYKKEGTIACAALLVYAAVVLFLFKIIPITLTLAGIAGFILSIGMAVDANILIFERMKEELRAGKARDIAVEIGFKRAWSSIRDSNISSLITCSILYYFGTGIVKNFALTLAIGILVSMFSAIILTRGLLRIFDKGIK